MPAALNESAQVIDLYRRLLAASPDQIREYRFLAHAYLLSRDGALDEAGKVIAAGCRLDPDDAMLLPIEAEFPDTRGRRDEALAAWRTSRNGTPRI